MRRQTPTRAAWDRKKTAAYDRIFQERPHCCEACGIPEYDHSHFFPVGKFLFWIGEDDNISLLCRNDHDNWEASRLWNLGPHVLNRVIKFLNSKIDDEHFEEAWAYLTSKLYKMRDLARKEKFQLPEEILIILDRWEIEP